jgi:hypothetical protein
LRKVTFFKKIASSVSPTSRVYWRVVY